MEIDTSKYVLFVTSKGGIIVELYNNEARETCKRFVEQTNLNRYQDTIIHRIVKNLFIQCGRYHVKDNNSNNNNKEGSSTLSSETISTLINNDTSTTTTTCTSLKSESTILDRLFNNSDDEFDDDYEDDDNDNIQINDLKDDCKKDKKHHELQRNRFKLLLEENIKNGLKFNERGMVALGAYNQIIITLDACDALTGKYPIFGRVHSSTLQILNLLENQSTDNTNCPLDPILITNIHFLNQLNNDPEPDHPPSLPPTPKLSPLDSLNNNNNNNSVFETPLKKRTYESTSTSTTSTTTTVQSNNNNNNQSILDTTPIIKRLKTKIMTGFIRTPTRLADEQQALMTCNLNNSTLMGIGQSIGMPSTKKMTRSTSMPYINVSRVKPKWPTRLTIIRHGQSQQNAALDLLQDDIDTLSNVRDADIKLTEIGIWQCKETGKYLAGTDKFDICFTSPYTRAINTANHIISQLPYNLKLYQDNWLREKEFGRGHGLTEKMTREKFPEEYAIRNRDGKYWYRPLGGENYVDVETRIHCFLEKLSRDYAGRSVLVITHQVPYKLFRGLFHHLDEAGLLGLEAVHNCGIQEYLLDTSKAIDGRMKMKHFNYKSYDMSNLPDHLKSKSTKPNH